MKKLRLSNSLINSWLRGNPDEVIATYFHLDRPKSKALEDGIKIHEDLEKHITKYNSFPDWFFDGPLLMPECEKKVIVEYNEMFDLSGVFDCIDGRTLYEFKSGVQNSLTWVGKDQIPLYFLIAELAKIDLDKVYLIHYNQHTKEKDFAVMWNSPSLVEKGRNIVDSYGPEIHAFFESEGLL